MRSVEDVAKGVAAGELSLPLGRFMPEPVPPSETFESLATTLGCSPEFLRRLSGEFGLPAAADDGLRAEDAEMLLHEGLGHADEVLEDGVLPVPALEPGHEAARELGEPGALLVDEVVLLLVRQIEGRNALAN